MCQKKRETDQALDPIRLSDMDSGDEWITKKEKPILEDGTPWLDFREWTMDLGYVEVVGLPEISAQLLGNGDARV